MPSMDGDPTGRGIGLRSFARMILPLGEGRRWGLCERSIHASGARPASARAAWVR